MREPRFWSDPKDIRGALFAPLGRLYAYATARRIAQAQPEALPIPVISVGNLNAGGTGKTPTVIALVDMLRGMGHVPHVVSRGYGGTLRGPVEVDPARHSAADVGDEPLLIAAFSDVWVSQNRAHGAQAAQAAGATAIVLDDAHQNPGLAKTLSLVCVGAETGFGNGRCIPAGPLREPVKIGLARADALVVIGSDDTRASFDHPDIPPGLPRLFAKLSTLQTGMDWTDQPYVAFAGIAHPDKFFDTLRGLGANLVRTEPLPDHAPLSPALLARLEGDAAALGAQLVTTEKDAARLPSRFRRKVLTLPVRLQFEDPDSLRALLPKP